MPGGVYMVKTEDPKRNRKTEVTAVFANSRDDRIAIKSDGKHRMAEMMPKGEGVIKSKQTVRVVPYPGNTGSGANQSSQCNCPQRMAPACQPACSLCCPQQTQQCQPCYYQQPQMQYSAPVQQQQHQQYPPVQYSVPAPIPQYQQAPCPPCPPCPQPQPYQMPQFVAQAQAPPMAFRPPPPPPPPAFPPIFAPPQQYHTYYPETPSSFTSCSTCPTCSTCSCSCSNPPSRGPRGTHVLDDRPRQPRQTPVRLHRNVVHIDENVLDSMSKGRTNARSNDNFRVVVRDSPIER